MRGLLKPLTDQIIVITGASSGIGLSTARMAARRGARLVLNSRNERALRQLADEINGQSGKAVYQVADVADESALRLRLERLARMMRAFGRAAAERLP